MSASACLNGQGKHTETSLAPFRRVCRKLEKEAVVRSLGLCVWLSTTSNQCVCDL